MLDRAYRLSSCWSYFSEECDFLKAVFSRLKYPQHLVNTTERCFVASKAEGPQPIPSPRDSPTVRIVLPFNDQASADLVHKQLKDLSQKIDTVIQPTFVGNKIQQELKIQERKSPIVNQNCVVLKFQCDLCDASYFGFTLRHYTSAWSSINTNLLLLASIFLTNTVMSLKTLKDIFCTNKFDCLVLRNVAN